MCKVLLWTPIFKGRSYGGVVREEDLGVGDDAGGKEGMGGIAETALHPAYDKGESFPVLFLWSGYRPRALRGGRSGRRNTPAGRPGWNPWHHHKIPVKFRCILL